MTEEVIKNWVTVSRDNLHKAIKWARKHPQYITNDYAVIGGRTEHYQPGDDYHHIDFFFNVGDVMKEFEQKFGVKE